MITHRIGLREWIVEDKGIGVRITSRSDNILQLGDRIAAVGFPEGRGTDRRLVQSRVELISRGAAPEPRTTTLVEIIQEGISQSFVRIPGTVIGLEERGTNRVLNLLSAQRIVRVGLPSDASGFNIDQIKPGASLDVQGIAYETESVGSEVGCRIQTRSVSDIVVTKPPPWWEVYGIGQYCVVVGLAALGLMGWMTMSKHRSEKRLRELTEREAEITGQYQDLFTNSNDIIYRHDLEGRLLDYNRAAELVFQCPRERGIGLNVFDYILPADREMARKSLASKLAGSSNTRYEIRMVTVQGGEFILEISSRLHRDRTGTTTVVGIARDVTERKMAEASLKDQEKRLRDLLAARERLGRDLHDGIIQSIYAVGLALDETRSLATTNPQSVDERLGRCVADLNSVIREVRSYIMGLEPESLDSEELRAALKSMVMTMNESTTCKFVLRVDPNISDNLTDSQATHLLFLAREAMSNVVRHSGAGSATVVLRTTGDLVILEIRDQGRGFNPQQAREGAGMGLRNISSRAEEMHARWFVESSPGMGTTLRIELPV